jgi:hypothetical protein
MMMDHAETRERLELAAVEPAGLDRLTPELLEHLRDCAECAAELDALRRSAPVINDVIRTTPSADLRERTLAYVREVGRPRQRETASAGARRGLREWLPTGWAAASTVAAILIAVVATGWIVTSRFDARLSDASAAISEQRQAIAGLAALSDWTLRLSSDPAAIRQRLLPPTGGDYGGTVLYSTETGELVMVATGLRPPPSGSEYRCWVERDGAHQPIGKLFFAGELGYWVGDVAEVMHATEAVIGVTLVDIESQDLGGDVTLQSES